MFESLTEKVSHAFKKLAGKATLTAANIEDTLAEVRAALLDADVALEVVSSFITAIEKKAVGQQVTQHLSPEQAFIKLVQDELIVLLGEKEAPLNLNAKAPQVILMAGLQGSGKTTTVGKLAKFLQEKHNKSVMVVSCDVYRPAAIEQLEIVAKTVGAEIYPSQATDDPLQVATAARDAAVKRGQDVLIVDTAGRLHIDHTMMDEVAAIARAVDPTETLFVLDSMTGQDAAKSARAFNDTLSLTGVVLTKIDGDARGGAALSVCQLTGKPIKFIGTGEKLEALESFYPERIASRILGMGDMLSLIEEIEQKVDKKEAEKLAKKMAKRKGFDLADFRDQLLQMDKMGGVASMLDKLPGMGGLPANLKDKISGDNMFGQMIAIINSMTPKERRHIDLIRGSRKRRIANGSGTQLQDVNRLLKQYKQMQKMMKKMTSKAGMAGMMRQLQGKMPPGWMPPGGLPPDFGG